MRDRRQLGFTLLEVLVTVAIIGILAAVALPNYRDYVRRGNLPEGLAALSDYRIKMEVYYQDYRRYGTAACADGANAPAWRSFTAPAGAKFSYSCVVTNAGQGYTITATGVTSGGAKGHAYTINHNQERSTVTFKGAASGKACWLVKGDEC